MVRISPGKMIGTGEKIKFIAEVAIVASGHQIKQNLQTGESKSYRDRLLKNNCPCSRQQS